MGIPPNRSSMIVAVTRNGASVTAFFPAVTHLVRDSLAIEPGYDTYGRGSRRRWPP